MLSPAQLDARRGKITGSRIACLMTGDAVKIDRLYREMIGEAVEDDLSHYWPARLGSCTEQLNLDWFEEKNGCTVTRRGEVVVHPLYEWAAVTLDGWVNVPPMPIECKHVGGREPLEVVIERYQPQLQWIMEVCGSEQIALSVIVGTNEPIVEYVDLDPEYAQEEIRRAAQFMECVRSRRPPVVLEPAPSPKDYSKVYDMSRNNVWCVAAPQWLEASPYVEVAREAEKVLKSTMPEDAKRAFGAGVRITRDRAGRLSLRRDEQS